MCNSQKSAKAVGFNGVRLIGDVKDAGNGVLTLVTSNWGFKGNVPTQFFETHRIQLGTIPAPETGKRVEVRGQLLQCLEHGKTVTRVHAISCGEPTISDGCLNTVKIQGRCMGAMQYRPADPISGRQGFGVLLVDTAACEGDMPRPVRSVLFQTQAQVWDRLITPNSSVVIYGFLRNREYVDNQGDNAVMTEVIAAKQGSRILEAKKFVDHFANFDGNPEPTIPAAPAGPESAMEPAAEPEKPKKGKKGAPDPSAF